MLIQSCRLYTVTYFFILHRLLINESMSDRHWSTWWSATQFALWQSVAFSCHTNGLFFSLRLL